MQRIALKGGAPNFVLQLPIHRHGTALLALFTLYVKHYLVGRNHGGKARDDLVVLALDLPTIVISGFAKLEEGCWLLVVAHVN